MKILASLLLVVCSLSYRTDRYTLFNEVIRENFAGMRYDFNLDTTTRRDFISYSYVRNNLKKITQALDKDEFTTFQEWAQMNSKVEPDVTFSTLTKLASWDKSKLINTNNKKEGTIIGATNPLVNYRETIMIINVCTASDPPSYGWRSTTYLYKKVDKKWKEVCTLSNKIAG